MNLEVSQNLFNFVVKLTKYSKDLNKFNYLTKFTPTLKDLTESAQPDQEFAMVHTHKVS